MLSFQASTWEDVEGFRARLSGRVTTSVEAAAQAFAEDLASGSPTVVLARVFLVLPLESLPKDERAFAKQLAADAPSLRARTPVLTLLGTAGRVAEWRDRKASRGHQAIPLLGSAHVQGIPMIAKLLADLEVNLEGLDDGKPIATRRLLGGKNAAFLVEDAETTCDAAGRRVIPSRDFVDAHKVKTVFGMGGAYADGTLAVTVIFTDERIDRVAVNRFPSLISNFKIATASSVLGGRIFASRA